MRNDNAQRRGVLGKLVMAGSAIVLGLGSGRMFGKRKSETIRLIDRDGKVHEVERRHLNKMCSGKVSNSRLNSWLRIKDGNDEKIG